MKKLYLFLLIIFTSIPLSVFSSNARDLPQKNTHKNEKVNKEKHSVKKHHKKHHTLTGQWKNDRGSILIIEAQSDSSITGSYFAATSDVKSCLEKALPVSGYLNKNIFSASINFSSCHSSKTVAISGYLSRDDLLHLFIVTQQSKSDNQGSQLIDTEIFSRKNS